MILLKRIFILLLLIFIIAACSKTPRDKRLKEIAEIVSDHPEEALVKLNAINPDSLSESNRHYFHLLSIKATDKAYITHKSDSLIRTVIEYAQNHTNEHFYPEALYYGGRVYSDLGDYPTALQYFQKALDQTPSDTKDINFRLNILSQTARLLNRLRLYNQALPYLNEIAVITSTLKDTIKEVYNLQMAAFTYTRLKDYDNAERVIKTAIEKSSTLPVSFKARSLMLMAALKYNTGKIDSALLLIRKVPPLVKPETRSTALAYAAKIYRDAGIIDSAYLCAKELINQPDYTNKSTGYEVLLSPELVHLSSLEDIHKYVSEYNKALEAYLNENENQAALVQHSLYNYSLHLQERLKAEKSNTILRYEVIVSISLFFVMIIIIQIFRNHKNKEIIRLQHALENISILDKEMKEDPNVNSLTGSGASVQLVNDRSINDSIPREEDLQEQLRNKLLDLYNKVGEKKEQVSAIILKSSIYQELQESIRQNKSIADDDIRWVELQNIVLESSPNFLSNLSLLTGGCLTPLDLKTALLIKCGIPPSQMGIVFSKTKGAIVSRRETLCRKVLGKKLGTKVIDAIIRSL